MATRHEWRDQAAGALYPFDSGATMRDLTGASTLAQGDIVDAVLVPRDPGEAGFHISSLTVSDETVAGAVSSSAGAFATFSASMATLPGSAVDLEDDLGVVRGALVFGRGADGLLAGMAAGQSNFGILGLPFHPPLAVAPASSRVSRFEVNGIPALGRVRLRAGSGIRLKASGSTVTVHATGAQSTEDCGRTGSPILSINTVTPNASGGLSVRPDETASPGEFVDPRQLIRVRANRNGITISLSELDR